MPPRIEPAKQWVLVAIDAEVTRRTVDAVVVSMMAAREYTPGLTLAGIRLALKNSGVYTFNSDNALDRYHRRAVSRLPRHK